ncbi:hypothetical protein D3C78_1757820 [compost metagenome]
MNGRAAASILPQVGAGGGTPRPRKLNALSARMTQPNMEVASTTRGATQLGRMCANTVRRPELPMTAEASMYSFSRSESTEPRTTRTAVGA